MRITASATTQWRGGLGAWLAVAMTLAAVSGCQPAGEGPPAAAAPDGMLSGTVTYRERMALPPDATIEVRLEDVSIADAAALVLAEQTIAAHGRQVPIPFELRYATDRLQPARRYAVRATIHDASGELLFATTTHHAVLDDRTPNQSVEILVQRAGRDATTTAAVGRTFVFDCDADVSFTVRTGPGEVALWAPASLGGQYVVLSATPAASGARYQEGDIVFWDRGSVARFEIAGRTFVDCAANPRKVPWADAARRGVTFRALGNEPAWSLEVAPGRLTMITELGARRTELTYAEPTVAGARTTYRAAADGHEVLAIVERGGCTDSMSGEAFEATATVTFDGTIFYGCGRFL